MSLLERKHCEICDKPSAKYSCPKCGIPYCSLVCYRDKKHLECTECFYKEQVEETMHAQKSDDQTKQQMRELLQRFHEQQEQDTIAEAITGDLSSDSDDSNDSSSPLTLSNRLRGLDIHDTAYTEEIWNRLSAKEKTEFLQLVSNHDPDILEPHWQPWWIETKVADVDCVVDPPEILRIGVPVHLLAKKVHPSVLFQIIQITLAYAYMMRHMDGDPRGKDNLPVSFDDLTTVSPLLASKEADIYQSTHEALVTALCNIDMGMSGETKCILLDDVLGILSKAEFIASVFSDLHGILSELLDIAKGAGVERARVKCALRRVYFLLSVVLQMIGDKEAWGFMATDVAMLRRRFESETQAMSTRDNDSEADIQIARMALD
ncbi:Zinc finger HIT domain-containing protein 2 [Kickxella alabastrina]|uniref:Zinc finger HIT domain-containing protein 2 n=1 Tax=Kickxella alabastrina TaxID=61397 RepID=A0ACC1IK28_9FUNG|nr:Zinc finger HIT domain-containing protein 2 [Kickxella alabastrina]